MIQGYTILTLLIVAIAMLRYDKIKPLVRWSLQSLIPKAPYDVHIGTLPVQSTDQLKSVFEQKRALVIGGTRGVGRGLSIALAKAGADVTVVGRSTKSGELILSELNTIATSQKIRYLQGDLSTVSSSHSLVEHLTEESLRYGTFDYLIVTAATFPDWGSPLLQEDGLDKSFAVAVMGRYILYRNMEKFLSPPIYAEDDSQLSLCPRVLNVIASGDLPLAKLDRSIASGQRTVSSLIETVAQISVGNELMIIGVSEKPSAAGYTMVSTHPGLLSTDLHRGQGWVFDMLEQILVTIMGISDEECGLRQASILASPALHQGSLSYIDSELRGRLRSVALQRDAEDNTPWLMTFLQQKIDASVRREES